mgnify:CR=1 FL=1
MILNAREDNMNMCRLSTVCFLVLLSTIFTLEVSWAGGLPSWLSGKPDLNIVEDRSALYEWVLQQADEQTNGLASQKALSKKRLINLSNKLADYSKKTAQKDFSVHLRYLIMETEQPLHCRFLITNEKSQQLLEQLNLWLGEHEISDPDQVSRANYVALGIYYTQQPTSQNQIGENNEHT